MNTKIHTKHAMLFIGIASGFSFLLFLLIGKGVQIPLPIVALMLFTLFAVGILLYKPAGHRK